MPDLKDFEGDLYDTVSLVLGVTRDETDTFCDRDSYPTGKGSRDRLRGRQLEVMESTCIDRIEARK
jgi:hypothetical protein